MQAHPSLPFWTVACAALTAGGSRPLPMFRSDRDDHTRIAVDFGPFAGEAIIGWELVFNLRFPAGAPLRVHHHALVKLHRQMTVPVDFQLGDARLLPAEGDASVPCGHQDNLLHNAFVLFQPGGPSWLVAPLTQRRALAGFLWNARDDGSVDITVRFTPLGQPHWTVTGDFAGETLYVQADAAPAPFGPTTFDRYHAALLADGTLGRVRRGPLARHELFWGTWNEGNYRRIDHAMILGEARWLAANLPAVRWVQVDDGYQADADFEDSGAAAGLADLGAHADPATAWCPRRFPRGMRALANDIRALGLRPMIWFSPACIVSRRLFRERPDLFIPDARLGYVRELAYPDFSQAEVRDLCRRALDRLFVEWGFEGVKLDFWTYQFLQKDLRQQQPGATGLEWMRWLETEIRQRLGPDGLMLSCLDPAQGDPFRSAVWDCHRVGPDIDGLTPDAFEKIAVWVAALTGLKQTQRHFWTPDADGLSLFRHGGLSDASWRLATAFLVASGAALEVAGRLSRQTDDPRLPALRRAVSTVRHGQTVECPGYDWTDNAGRAPRVWCRRDDDGGGVLGLLNWQGPTATLPVPPALVGLTAQDIFTGEISLLPADVSLPAGEAALFHFAGGNAFT